MPGHPWSPEKFAHAHGESVHEMQMRKRVNCALHLTRAIEARGRIELGPRTMAGLREAGYGASVVAWALAAMMDKGVVAAHRESGKIVLIETVQDLELAA